MKISKKQLTYIIKEAINDEETALKDLGEYIPRDTDYRGEDSGIHHYELFGDYVWPQHNPSNNSEEPDTRIEEKALSSIIDYYKNNNPFEGQSLPPDVGVALKKIVDNGLYPHIFERQIKPSYRGMALYQEDYYQIFGQIPIPEETLTKSEAEKFRTNPKESDLSKEEKETYEREYEEIKNGLIQLGADPDTIPGPYDPAYDKFKKGMAMTKIPLKNYFERFISFLSRESQLSGTTNRYVQAKNLKQKTFKSSEDIEKRNFTQQDIEDYFLQTGKEDTSYSSYTVSDWTKSKSDANLYAKKAAELLKAKKKDSSVIPFILETNVYDNPPTVFSIYDALQNYPSIATQLEGRLNPNDLLLIGDASLSRVFVLDTRGMGLGYPVPPRIVFSRINNAFENALKGLGNYVKSMYDSTLRILGLREGKNEKMKITKNQLRILIRESIDKFVGDNKKVDYLSHKPFGKMIGDNKKSYNLDDDSEDESEDNLDVSSQELDADDADDIEEYSPQFEDGYEEENYLWSQTVKDSEGMWDDDDLPPENKEEEKLASLGYVKRNTYMVNPFTGTEMRHGGSITRNGVAYYKSEKFDYISEDFIILTKIYEYEPDLYTGIIEIKSYADKPHYTSLGYYNVPELEEGVYLEGIISLMENLKFKLIEEGEQNIRYFRDRAEIALLNADKIKSMATPFKKGKKLFDPEKARDMIKKSFETIDDPDLEVDDDEKIDSLDDSMGQVRDIMAKVEGVPKSYLLAMNEEDKQVVSDVRLALSQNPSMIFNRELSHFPPDQFSYRVNYVIVGDFDGTKAVWFNPTENFDTVLFY